MRTLVWITNSFRLGSRLTAALEGEVTFVYYSPYYFAGKREREMYKRCSQANLDAFYESLHAFDFELQSMDFRLHVFKEADPIAHINNLIVEHEYDEVILDMPLFGLWHNIAFHDINAKVGVIDSALVDDECFKLTAKSRWMTHVKSIDSFKPFKFSKTASPYNLCDTGCTYPSPSAVSALLDPAAALKRARKMAPTYHVTRDRHDGQTQLSTILHNGRLDPRTVFYTLAKDFKAAGADLTVNEGSSAGMLRQLAFREIAIIRARRANLTLEDDALTIAKALMPASSYENLIAQKPGGKVTFDMVKAGNTGVRVLDVLLKPFLKTGIMPNRARMLFASHIFYNSPTGVDALNTLLDTFDLLGLDGQSPNNMISVCGALELSYGQVLKMNIDTAMDKLYNKA